MYAYQVEAKDILREATNAILTTVTKEKPECVPDNGAMEGRIVQEIRDMKKLYESRMEKQDKEIEMLHSQFLSLNIDANSRRLDPERTTGTRKLATFAEAVTRAPRGPAPSPRLQTTKREHQEL